MNVKLILIKKIIKTNISKYSTNAAPEVTGRCKCKQTKIRIKNGAKQAYPLTI